MTKKVFDVLCVECGGSGLAPTGSGQCATCGGTGRIKKVVEVK